MLENGRRGGVMKLVVGLGNPGEKYKNHRHNVGFRVADLLATVNHAGAWKSQFDGLVADGFIENVRTLILKPMTFMNRSGQAVRKAVDFYKLPLDDVLVVCDDLNLPLGKLRLRRQGSSGGNRGLEDVIAHLGTEEVSRLRVGIGAPRGDDAVEHVLDDFAASERSTIEAAIIDAVRAVERWVSSGIDAAMSEFNRRESSKE
jgi:PTH1 family peptidyl-tRNA hydrolase